jgi:hypothetical protein
LNAAAPAGSDRSQDEGQDVALTKLVLIGLVFSTVAAVAGCSDREREPAAARHAVAGAPAVYTVGAKVFGLRGGPARLASPPVAPLAGWLTPAAVPSPDARYLAYNAWRELRHDDPRLSWSDQGIELGDPLATPSIRIYDTRLRADDLLVEGAFSLAWRADGTLAYFKGAERDYRAGVSYVGDVLVRPSLEATPETWSSERGRYIVVGWAGTRLVGYREREGEALDVVVFDGPGRMRVLAADSALVAISPEGRRAFVEQGPAQGRPRVRVISVATGRATAALDLTTVDPAVGTVGYAGDWRGDRVVASSASGLAVFRVQRGKITLENSLRIAASSVAEPRFVDESGRRVKAWTSIRRGGVFLECDFALGACNRTMPLREAPGVHGFPAWRRPLYNPSRPLGAS